MKRFSLKRLMAGLEDGIIVLSGPALAISGIIAGVDLVTGGNILKNQPGLTLAWAITLLLTLDFQVLALGVRGMRVYHSDKPTFRKVGEVLLIVFIAAAISFVSIQMQSIIARVNAEGISIDQAATQLGISMIALTWERSTLVLVLIFMSGWLREDADPQSTPKPSLAQTAQPVSVTQVGPVQPAPLQIEAPGKPESSPANLESSDERRVPMYRGRFESKEPAIRAVLQRHPQASAQEIAQAVQCSPRTAQRWLDKLGQEQAS